GRSLASPWIPAFAGTPKIAEQRMAVQAIGQRVRREEDFRLLTGRGRYVDDVPAIGALRGYVLRSPHAHARITSIDADEAKTSPPARRRYGPTIPATRLSPSRPAIVWR